MPTVPFLFQPTKKAPFFGYFLSFRRLAAIDYSSLPLTVPVRGEQPTCDKLLDAARLASSLGITPESLRTYWQKLTVLHAAKSDQVLQVVRVIELGHEVFGAATSFNAWLLKPAYGLAGRVPLTLFCVSGGIDLVADELIRIAYGDAS